MKKNFSLLFLASLLFCSCDQEPPQKDYLKIDGQNFVNSKGEKVFLRSVGLGNWLLPEGYMWKFGPNGDRPRKIEKIVVELIGEREARKFWKEFRKNYITETDIKRISELGFNCVRPALNARIFMTEEDNPQFLEDGFVLIDDLIKWCKKYNLYVVLDMHGAPGGQTGENIDDSPNNRPELFMEKKHQDNLEKLWVEIAKRYKDETTVIAYDLLNEPLPSHDEDFEKLKPLVEPLYKRLTAAIRKVDPNHMITLEGVNWSNDWSIFGPPFDNNTFYQFHYYCWDRPDHLKSVQQYIDRREELNTPIWVGETGEQGNAIFWGTTQYFEQNNIGWSFWPWKKMDTENTPYSINKPDNWDLIEAYSYGGEMVDSSIAQEAFFRLLENIKLEKCEYYDEVVNAIFRRVPGKIEAENYGHHGLNKSYFVNDTSFLSERYRIDDPVPIDVIDLNKDDRISDNYIILKENEWTNYDFNSLEPKFYELSIKTKSEQKGSKILIILDDQIFKAEPKSEWETFQIGNFNINKGKNSIQLKIEKGSAEIDWIELK